MIAVAAAAHPLNYVILCYFNVAGADAGGRLGQSGGVATHLIRVACQTAEARGRVGLRMRESVLTGSNGSGWTPIAGVDPDRGAYRSPTRPRYYGPRYYGWLPATGPACSTGGRTDSEGIHVAAALALPLLPPTATPSVRLQLNPIRTACRPTAPDSNPTPATQCLAITGAAR